MKTIDLSKEQHTVSELLEWAKADAVLIRTADGEDFILEQADELEREAAALGASEAFMAFLKSRSQESGSVSLREVKRKIGA